MIQSFNPTMKVSLNWLKDFVDVPADPRELKSRLTMLGLGVESFTADGEDEILEAEITTNRPDCLSHYGIAREIATTYLKPLKRLDVVVKESEPAASGEIGIEILNPDLCARYCGRVIRNVEVKPSPQWLARRLQAVGLRPINNVADVTNYVLMELGHPLHAFDLARLAERQIVVRRARPGETLKMLDGATRALTVDNLVIADAGRPVALAGVMGGEESAITAATKSVLLESAWFDPVTIRRTAKMHGLHTEASHRFERGADIEMAPLALDRAAELIRELAGGEILRGLLDVYPKPRKRERIVLRRGEILRVLGTEVAGEDVERILPPLGFAVERDGSEGWNVIPPSFRLDVTRQVDLIEEVARHFGYDHLPARLIPAPPRAERDLLREKESALSQRLVSLGYREIITTSMIDPAENLKFSGSQSVVLENPLSQEASALRTTMIPSMVAALRWNLDRDREDLRFYEFGKVYWFAPDGIPKERRVLAIGLTGNRRSISVHESAKAADFFDLKGDLESLWEIFDLGQVTFISEDGGGYEPGIHGRFSRGGKALAAFGQLAAEAAAAYKLRQAVFVAEIDLDALLNCDLRSKAFRPYSKFPAVARDFSLLVPHGISYRRLTETLQSLDLPDLVEFRPVDLFLGGAIGSERYSLLLRLTFQNSTHTLTSEEVAAAGQRIVEALELIGVRLRA